MAGKLHHKITKTKLKRILQSKYDKLKARNPHLSESEIDKLFVEQQQEYKRQKTLKAKAAESKRRARIRAKNKAGRYTTFDDGQLKPPNEVSGGGVNPR